MLSALGDFSYLVFTKNPYEVGTMIPPFNILLLKKNGILTKLNTLPKAKGRMRIQNQVCLQLASWIYMVEAYTVYMFLSVLSGHQDQDSIKDFSVKMKWVVNLNGYVRFEFQILAWIIIF